MATHSSILAWRIHGQRSLAGYSPWRRKELDTNEQFSLSYTLLILYNHLIYLGNNTIQKLQYCSTAFMSLILDLENPWYSKLDYQLLHHCRDIKCVLQ